MINEIINRLEADIFFFDSNIGIAPNIKIGLEIAKEIVQEVAKEYEDKANEAREDFMEIVYAELDEDADNNRANRIIDAFDTFAPYQKGE